MAEGTVNAYSPFPYIGIFIFVIFISIILFSKPRPTLEQLFACFNSLDQNPTAIIVIILGIITLGVSKKWGVADDLASTIVGGGLLLLKSHITGQSSTTIHKDDSGKTTTDYTETKSSAPPATPLPASEVKSTEVPPHA